MLRDEKARCRLANLRETAPNNRTWIKSEIICLLTQQKSNFPTTVFRLTTVNLFDNSSIFDEFLDAAEQAIYWKQPFQLTVQSY